jgi:uncharacterized membrane protein YgcG
MHKRLISAAVVLSSVPLVGGMAYAAAQSVSTRPAAQVVIPTGADRHRDGVEPGDDRATATTADHKDPAAHDAGDDDRPVAVHDAKDDRNAVTTVPTTMPSPSTVPTTVVAVVDDRGRGGPGLDDPAGRDVGDDHGGRATTTTVPTTRTTVAPAGDDRGRQAEPADDRATGGSGRDGSGSGRGTSGSGGSSGGKG